MPLPARVRGGGFVVVAVRCSRSRSDGSDRWCNRTHRTAWRNGYTKRAAGRTYRIAPIT
jgi:hypothetical protein